MRRIISLANRTKEIRSEIRKGFAKFPQDNLKTTNGASSVRSPFISAHIDRKFDTPYNGDVFLWDIDKTYLQTHFSSWRGLAAIPFERALDKKAVPGTVSLLRALRRGPENNQTALLPLYFISGSPPQLRSVIEQKMTLDGVHFDGLIFKDQWGLVRAGRPNDVKKQIGYKLSALLTLKLYIPGQPRFYCFGDDVESDAEVFSLFSEVMKGLSKAKLLKELERHEVHEDDIADIFSILEEPSMRESIEAYQEITPVKQIFIHLDRRTKPDTLQNELVFPTFNFLQTAMVLTHLGRIPESSITSVAQDLRRNNMSERAIKRYVDDALNRFNLPKKIALLAQR
jgi:hypothetical protein